MLPPIDEILKNNHFQIIYYMIKNDLLTEADAKKVLNWAAALGHLCVIECIYEKRILLIYMDDQYIALAAAVLAEHYHVVRYLAELNIKGFDILRASNTLQIKK
jgi:hypothetical protein